MEFSVPPQFPMPMLEIPLSRSKRWSERFRTQVHDDDMLWSEYLHTAKAFDIRLVEDLNRIVDVILVYVGIICYLHGTSCCLSSNRA
jgi:hypothetical protein